MNSKERKTRLCLLPSCKGKRFDLVHKFPMDNERAEKWKTILNMPELRNLSIDIIRKRYFICSKHFRKEDYKNCESRNLNKTAYPRLYLSFDSNLELSELSPNGQTKFLHQDDDRSNGSKVLDEFISIENDVHTPISTAQFLLNKQPQFLQEIVLPESARIVATNNKKKKIFAKTVSNVVGNIMNNPQNRIEASIQEIRVNVPHNVLLQDSFIIASNMPVAANDDDFVSMKEDIALLEVVNDEEFLTDFDKSPLLLQSNNNDFITHENVEVVGYKPNLLKLFENFLELSNIRSGEPAIFNYFWLRDHCHCSGCYAQNTKQRINNIMDIPLEIKPKECTVIDDELMIQWSDGHESEYNISTLLNLQSSYAIERLTAENVTKLWRKCTIESEVAYARVSLNDYLCQESTAKSVVESLIHYGIAFIENVPPNMLSTEMAIKRLFPIQKTLFGEMWSLQDTKSHSDSAYSEQELRAHTDNTYFNDAAGLQIFHCIENAESGGETLLVDGFRAVQDVRDNSAESFDRLCTVNVPAEYIEDGEYHRYCAPIVRLDPTTGEPLQIRFNLSDRAPLNTLPQREMPTFYKALKDLTAEIRRPDNEWWFKLTPGTVCIFNNWRILHGRASYIGRRRLVGAYVSHTHFMSVARNFGIVE